MQPHEIEHRLDDELGKLFGGVVIDGMERSYGTHTARVGATIIILKAFVIACGRQHTIAFAITNRDQRNFGP